VEDVLVPLGSRPCTGARSGRRNELVKLCLCCLNECGEQFTQLRKSILNAMEPRSRMAI
jgi:hypothetical protein